MQIYIYKLYYFVHFILQVVHVLPIHFLCIEYYFSSNLFDILASRIFVFTEKREQFHLLMPYNVPIKYTSSS